jgi:hypothetical protein
MPDSYGSMLLLDISPVFFLVWTSLRIEIKTDIDILVGKDICMEAFQNDDDMSVRGWYITLICTDMNVVFISMLRLRN